MADPELERDLQSVVILDEALAELRACGTLDVAAWQARHPKLAGDMAARLELLRELETRLGSCRSAPAPHPQSSTAAAEPEYAGLLAPAQQADELGRLGQYRVLQVLGTGGMGIVLLAEDPHLQRRVALKIMRPVAALSPTARQRFIQEARLAAGLRHDHLVTIFQVGEDRNVPYLAMELLQGESLEERLRREIKLPWPEVVRIGREIAEGLAAAHQGGLIHRDIKPANVWLEAGTGRVKILDFGLARAVVGDVRMTQTGVFLGTPNYMAPEQAAGKPVDGRCDLFSLGCVLYRLSAGELPFQGSDPMSSIAAMALTAARPLAQVNPVLPRPLCDLVMQLLSKDPNDRPASAQALAQAMAAIERDLAAGAEENCRGAMAPRAPGRRRTMLAVVALALLAGVLLAGAMFTFRTTDGVLVIHLMEEGVQVLVDEYREVTIDSPKVGKITLSAGEHQLKVKRGSEELLTTSFTLKSGGEVILLARWEAKSSTKPASKSPVVQATPPRAVDPWFQVISSLRPELQVEAVKDELKRRNPGFDGQVVPTIKDGVVETLCFSTDQVSDISPVRVLVGLKMLICSAAAKGQLADLSPLSGLPLKRLLVARNQIKDLSPLKSITTLETLHLTSNPVQDLSPLTRLPIRQLLCDDTGVRNLSPLKGMKLRLLHVAVTPVRDLTPLQGMPLEGFASYRSHSRDSAYPFDLKPLKDLPLKKIECDLLPERDAEVLRSIRTLETINHQPAAEVWKKVDAEQAEFARWSESLRKLPPDQQLDAVVARLKERNPGFDGKVTPALAKDAVTGLSLDSDLVKVLSPVRALAGLQTLRCAGSQPGKGLLTNLWPLKGLALTSLDVSNNPSLCDLEMLAGMKLTHVHFQETWVDDLSPLRSMPLREIHGLVQPARDAAILKKITTLEIINDKPAAEVLGTLSEAR